ncbi:MAG: RICIN domain-containing protein, partial [Saprospiraceae bacterium]|nr:RICIN domain-containing protein [Saprospiraceae bacterium]
MKKQENNTVQWKFKFLFGICLCFLLLSTKGKAQNALTANGQTHTISYSGRYVDYIVPTTSTYHSIYVKALGGDGGDATNHSPDGGRGAQVEGYLKVNPGDTFRFIVGRKGESKGDYGGGGGGTAIAIKKNGEDTWQLVLVAGGGGGAGLDRDGREGTTSTSGSNGISTNDLFQDGHAYNAGTNGNGGGNADGGSGGGKSTAGKGGYGDTYGGQPGYSNGIPTGGIGGIGGQNQAGSASWAVGGWGFGGGGAAYRSSSDLHSGGGGGGYSGGGGGQNEGGAGGGGSYSNIAYLINASKTSRGSGNSPLDGWISYQFLPNELGPVLAINWQGFSKCIDNSGGKTDDHNKIQLWDCQSDNPNQKWVFLPDFTIRLASSMDKCLDLENRNTSNNTKIQLYQCNGTGAQKWIFEGTTMMIRYHDNMNKCLTIDKHDGSNGSQVYLYDCSRGNLGQQWNGQGFAAAYTSTSHVRSIRPDYATSKAFDKTGVNAEDAKIWLWDYSSSNTNQQWTFDDFAIKLKKEINNTEMCIDLPSRNTKNGQDLQIHHCNNTVAQQWIYDGIFKAIRYKGDLNKCIDV